MKIKNWDKFYEICDELMISRCVRKCYEKHVMLNDAYMYDSMSMINMWAWAWNEIMNDERETEV
jgi:hypothetical protein